MPRYWDNGSSEVPKGIRDSEHRQCKCLFYFHFERSGGSWSTNSSILPSTFGSSRARFRNSTVQQRACCQKKISDSRVGHDVRWDWWDSVEISVSSSYRQKALKNLVVIVNTRPGQNQKGCRVNRVKEFPCLSNSNLQTIQKREGRWKPNLPCARLETPLRAKFYSEPSKLVPFLQSRVTPESSLIPQGSFIVQFVMIPWSLLILSYYLFEAISTLVKSMGKEFHDLVQFPRR